jgi:hypothetical protein
LLPEFPGIAQKQIVSVKKEKKGTGAVVFH